ncbi:MAG: ribonuclease Y [Lachnospiraceae bacterium]|nr:ribonuclease Y [Lachnospiraceae bacterium]
MNAITLNIIIAIVAVVVTVFIAVPISSKAAITKKFQKDDEQIGIAEEKARNIINEALKTAEAKKREAFLEAQEENLKIKNEQDREYRERRWELQKYEQRVLCKEESIDRKAEVLERRGNDLVVQEEELKKKEKKIDDLHNQAIQKLERISGLTSEQAKKSLLDSVEDELRIDTAKLYQELESKAKEEANRKAKDFVVTAIQKCAVDYVSEFTISVVQLPNDEMKGRIIGREGRNIRTLELLTGVDLIIDDTPEAVVLSSFDPIRREIARVALERLIIDGRIHPARIEEMVEKAQKEIDTMIREEGEMAALEVGVHGLHRDLIRLLGRMKFRFSYGQSALKHSIEVARLTGLISGEIGLDVRIAKRAGLLHDIGKSIDHEVEGSHIQIGAELCRKYKESNIVINTVESHHGDIEPQSLIACIVQAADAISAARPGARKETLETYINRLKQLENITNSFKGVEKSFAIQAGREVRIMVVPEQVNDTDMVLMARDISKQIESELEYPGQIKVNVIRESRVTDYAT